MNLWFNKRDGNYSAGGGGSWIRAYVDKVLRDLTDKYQKHIKAEADRHKADDVDYSDDITVRGKIDAETTERETADSTLQLKINAETANRESSDNALQSKINTETSERKAADSALQSSINAENAEREKWEQVYTVDISKVGSGNNILYITIPGITSYSQLSGRVIRVYTSAYSNTNTKPSNIYLNVNGLGNKAILRPIPSLKADYDSKEYYTDLYYAREINRYTTMELSVMGSTVMWLNPTPPCRATANQLNEGTENAAYLTPDLVGPALKSKADKIGVIDITDEQCPIQETKSLDDVVPYEFGTWESYEVIYSGKDSQGENIYRIALLVTSYVQIGGDSWHIQRYTDEYGHTYERRKPSGDTDREWGTWSSILHAMYVTENENYRFVTDVEKAKWNAYDSRITDEAAARSAADSDITSEIETVKSNIGNLNELRIQGENSNTVVNAINELVNYHKVVTGDYIRYEDEVNLDTYLEDGWYTFNWFSDSYGDYESEYQNSESLYVKTLNERTFDQITPKIVLQMLYDNNGSIKFRFITDDGENINCGSWQSLPSTSYVDNKFSELEARVAALEAPNGSTAAYVQVNA